MKDFELGAKVKIMSYYNRNGHKPHRESNCKRYDLIDGDKEGIWIGKRRIYVKGYSTSDYDEGFVFNPVESETVHLVAISKTRTVYVPDSKIEPV